MIGMKICENENLKQTPVSSFEYILLSFSGMWTVRASPEGEGGKVKAYAQVWVAAGEN